jgi:YggT family protein
MYNPIIWLLLRLLDLYSWVVIAAVIASWLIAFNVINLHNQFVRQVMRVLDALTEPLFRQVRRVIPPFGGLDLSPLIVLIGIWFLEYVIAWATVRFALY